MRSTSGKSTLIATVALASFSAGVLALPVSAQAQETTKTTDSAFYGILVSGTGEVQVKPDIARVSLGVQNQGKEASGVAQENAQKTDALIKAVKAAGVADKDIRTGDYNIEPQYPNPGIRPNGQLYTTDSPPKIIGYNARNTVTITVRRIADSGKVIDAAIKAGGNIANGISFDVSDSTAAQDEALQKAVADALRRAKAIAKAAGVANLYLVSIQESSYSLPQPMFRTASLSQGNTALSTPIQAGEQTVTANVSVRFRWGSIITPIDTAK